MANSLYHVLICDRVGIVFSLDYPLAGIFHLWGRNDELSNTIFISAIAIIGLTFSIMLITMNVTSSYFDLYSFVVRYLTDNSQDGKTIVGHRWTWAFTWIPHYAFDETVYFEHFNSTAQIKTDKFLLLVDNYVKRHLSNNDIISKSNLAHALYNNSHVINRIEDKSVSHDGDLYPYT